jgi:hypothetical protein
LIEEELTRTGLSMLMPLPDAGPKVKVNESPFAIEAVEDGLPLVMVMKRLDCWPAGKMGGEMLTTGVMAEEVCAAVECGDATVNSATISIRVALFIMPPV